ncbi:hypothetical protein CERZMDRAFT_102607 [Cercospora zeae-maydis SCOH1-5]|uniref:UBA domain-containing protein n=1 Tax=Cercospora zeae-maydis SCOH1-5 TaxID=717836 RepID=A0A6A6EZI3_9PEZI|nr:hypothetical protein CERZMDRAFT_102607 [Cercospora zeae-maydis SCOH1-5]
MASKEPAKRKRVITYGKKPRRRLHFQSIDLPSELLADPLGQPCNPDELKNMSFVPSNYQPEPLRPSSQKAATMTVEPSDEQIQTLIDFTGTDAGTAKRFLRVKQCNVETAVHAILEGEDIVKLEQGISWDPNLMTADRDGNNNLHPLGASAAPTRGNSPAPSLKDSAPTSNEQEDAQMAQALAQSQDMFGPYDGWSQETGTVGKDGTELRKIGPSTQKEYEEARWGMVLHDANELVPDVPLEERVQQIGDDAPRFLKHAPDGHYMPNFLTISHNIPVVREAFLLAGQGITDYGYASDWWKGATIPKPRIVQTDSEASADDAAEAANEFVAELHRLTAFLECGARVYANSGGLSKTDVMKACPTAINPLQHFLNSYSEVAGARCGNEAGQIAELFCSRAAAIGTSEVKETTNVLSLAANCADDVPEDAKPDLVECLDRLVWSTDSDDPEPQQYYLRQFGKVLVMRLEQENRSASHLNIRVPATLIMDKYAEENIEATGPLRQQLVRSKRRIKKITDVEQKLKYWTKDDKQMDASQLLRHTLGHFSGQNRRDVDQADKTNTASLSTNQPEGHAETARQLEAVMANIDEKLKLLAEEKEKAKKAISDLSKATIPGLEAQERQYRYTLRGVATKPHITYLLRPKNEKDEQPENAEHNEHAGQPTTMVDGTINDDETTTPPGFQWWRIDYEVTGQNAKLTRSKADDFDVIRAVELEHNSALLVYASDDAVEDIDISDLPPPLLEFIRQDNEQLSSDIEASKRNPPPPYPGDQGGLSDLVRASVEAGDHDDDADSTKAQYDGADYESTNDDMPRMATARWINDNAGDRDPSPVDIHLPPENNTLPSGANHITQHDVASESREVEMIERKVSVEHSEDVGMSGTGESQDVGIGGAPTHAKADELLDH